MNSKKPKRNDPRWVAVATTSMPDPRPARKGVRRPHVVVSQLIDDQGRHWERYGDDEPVMLGTPPRANANGG